MRAADANAPPRAAGWVDETSCPALCQLILDDRKGGGGLHAQVAAAAAAPEERRQRRTLPSTLYANHVAPFLRFDEPLPNMLYAIGGRSHRHGALSEVDMLDTWHGRWVPCPDMPTRRAGGGAAPLPNGRIIVVGGYDERGIVDGLLASCDIYDAYKHRWEEHGAAPLARARWGHGCAALGGQVYAVGGCSLQQGSHHQEPREAFMETLRSCEVYDPAIDRWTSCAPLQVARSGVRVVAVKDRYLAAVGGCDDVFGRADTQPTVELYDPEAACWTVLSVRLQHPRTTAAVAALGSGCIAVVGGAPSLASAEVYKVALPPCSGSSDACSGSQDSQESVTSEPIDTEASADGTEQVPSLADLAEGRMGCQAATLLLPAEGTSYPAGTHTSRLSVAIVGGERCSDGAAGEWPRVRQFAAVPVFDVVSGAWRPADAQVVPPLRSPRTAVALCTGLGRVQLPPSGVACTATADASQGEGDGGTSFPQGP